MILTLLTESPIYLLIGLPVGVVVYFILFNVVYQYYRRIRYYLTLPKGAKSIPFAAGALPLVGHGPAFSKDIIGFIKKQYDQYGPIFRIQVFRSEFVVICDHSLVEQYFKTSENDLSLYDALRRIYFGEAFSDRAESLETIIKLVKSTVKVDFEEFSRKIVDEAHAMIFRLKSRVREAGVNDGVFHLKNEMIRFVARTSARCFISVDISEDFFDTLMEFTDLLNQLVIMTYFLPRKLIKMTMGRKLDKLRYKMTEQLHDTIEEYRQDPEKRDSLVFRKAVDYNNGELTNAEIGDIVVCLLYVSSENTALGLTNCIIDMVENPECIAEVVDNVSEAIERDDFKRLFSNTYLDSCVMESARMNTHIFPLNRRSRHSSALIGDYYIGDTECVAICEPMMMKDPDCASVKFKDPMKFNPRRFIDGGESSRPQSVMTWGAGTHLCPGKQFAVYEIKTAVSLLFTTFKIVPHDIGKHEYFSPSAYAERSFDAKLELLENKTVKKPSLEEMNNYIVYNGKKVKFEEPEPHVLILRDAIPTEQIKRMYNQTIERAKGTEPYEIHSNPERVIPPTVAFPIAYQNLIYTGSSTCDLGFWTEWANDLWGLVYSHPLTSLTLNTDAKQFDSVYVQLYHQDSHLKSHKDQYVNWGISVSIGATCVFQLGDQTVKLYSGDVMIADFSQIEHSVVEISPMNIPGWFDPESGDECMQTFGNVRCSVQIRDISKCPRPEKIMTDSEFCNMLIQKNEKKMM